MLQSPPSLAVWIEIPIIQKKIYELKSPPSLAVWIEISISSELSSFASVTAFAGGVD